MSDTLAEICSKKREHIASRKKQHSESALLAQAKGNPAPRGFKKALEKKKSEGQFGLIAEIKKASPSHGLIREDFDPALLAVAYQSGGAACLSVLTDEPYFQGHDEYIAIAHNAAMLPVLRKDFMLEPYQIIESRALETDCILIIMAALTDAEASELHAATLELGMDALVEVHDRAELDRALKLNPAMIGVNNRNLKTLATDLGTAETLAKAIPASILAVGESGLKTHSDLVRLEKAGITTFLVGESLMRMPDVTFATRQLLGLKHD